MSFRYRIVIYAVIVGTAAIFPTAFFKMQFARPVSLSAPDRNTNVYDYLLLIIRDQEQRLASFPGVPYRNSKVFLYRLINQSSQSAFSWELVKGPLIARSESTSEFEPEAEDLEFVESQISSKGKYTYGYKSIPLGIYWGLWRKDSEARHPYALLVSDYKSLSGEILLDSPEVLYVRRNSDVSAFPAQVTSETSSTKTVKSACFIHSSRSQSWFHGDSNGCINLFHQDEHSDWDEFVSWFSSYDTVANGPVPIIITGPDAFEYPPSTLDYDELVLLCEKLKNGERLRDETN